VQATIRIDGEDPSGLMSLLRWLQRDESLVGRCTASLEAGDEVGPMGLEVIGLVLTHLTALSSVAIAYAAWRDSRPRTQRPKATLAGPGVDFVFDGDDLRITVRNASAAAIGAIVEAVVSVVRIDASAG
jgi:hypothetical protein